MTVLISALKLPIGISLDKEMFLDIMPIGNEITKRRREGSKWAWEKKSKSFWMCEE